MKAWKLALHGRSAAQYTVKAETRREAANKLRQRFPNMIITAHRDVREVRDGEYLTEANQCNDIRALE